MNDQLASAIFGTTRHVTWVGLLPLLLLLAGAAWTDLRSHRIPNPLVFGGALLALLLHAILPAGEGFLSLLPGGFGLLPSLQGWLIGLGVLLPLYLLGAMGAGDVKLMAMVGAFLGPRDTLGALLSIALHGGLLALALAAWRGTLPHLLSNIRLVAWTSAIEAAGGSLPKLGAFHASSRLPYGVAIAAGTIAYAAWRSRQLHWW